MIGVRGVSILVVLDKPPKPSARPATWWPHCCVSILVVLDQHPKLDLFGGEASVSAGFQSLLFWISLRNHLPGGPHGGRNPEFQSLLFWISLRNNTLRRNRSGPTRGFNPCCS